MTKRLKAVRNPVNFNYNKRLKHSLSNLDVQELIKNREVARTNKDFKTADLLRQELVKRGLAVQDTPSGQQVRLVNILCEQSERSGFAPTS